MFRDILTNRLFIGALAFFVLCVGGSLLYMWHVDRQETRKLYKAREHVAQWNARQNPTTAEVPVGDTSQGGHFHEDSTFHVEPHETPVDRPVLPPIEVELPPKFVKPVQDSQDVTIADQVLASGDVPDRAELEAMSDEQLSELIDESYEKMRELAPKMNNAMSEWAKVVGDLTRHAKTREENDAILTENAHLVQPLREKMESAAWEYHVHSGTAKKAFKISSARFIRTHHPGQTDEFWADYWVNF